MSKATTVDLAKVDEFLERSFDHYVYATHDELRDRFADAVNMLGELREELERQRAERR